MRINDPLICHACGKVYLEGDDDGVCDDPRCLGAKLDHLLGFVSYRRHCKTHRGIEDNDIAVRIKDRVEKVLHARQIGGGFFIDKTGIEREDFEKKIAKTIKACTGRIFLLILTPGALDPQENEGEDWLRKEIRLALEHKLEIVPVIALKYRQDSYFEWPEMLSTEIAIIQKKNVTLRFIGNLDEQSLVDETQNITSEIVRSIEANLIAMLQAKPGQNQVKNTRESWLRTRPRWPQSPQRGDLQPDYDLAVRRNPGSSEKPAWGPRRRDLGDSGVSVGCRGVTYCDPVCA